MDYPKLRPLNVFTVEMSGQNLVCLQDPQNISEKALFLPPALYFVASHFDGHHSLLDIQAEYMRRFGEFLFTEKIQEIIRQLDDNLFLEGDRFQDALKQAEDSFKQSPVREATFAGKSYEADSGRLKAQLEAYFGGPDGPGPLSERKGKNGLKGLVAPHIDFQRGGFCYAHAHREWWERSSSHCFIILGTAHVPMQHPFCLTRKNFKTPLGTVDADDDLIEAIQSRCPYDLFHDERAHRTEHSIEFQCVFLRYLIPEPTPLKIVPILSGSFHEALSKGISPLEVRPVRQFIEALKSALQSVGRDVCWLASADLAHVGLQFGDPEGVKEYDLRILAEEDQERLGYVERMDAEGFFQSILREQDHRRICGLPAIYTLLSALDAGQGILLKYGQAFTAEAQSMVSFASLAFY